MSDFFRSFFRAARRHRLYMALNIIGLALGMATFLTLHLVGRYELGWDSWYHGAQTIYRLETDLHFGAHRFQENTAPTLLLPAIRNRFPGLVATRFIPVSGQIMTPNREAVASVDVSGGFVDASFLRVFSLAFQQGSPEAALAAPSRITLSARLAQQLFGDQNPMGKTITLSYKHHHAQYTVAGVLARHPSNTSLALDFLALRPTAEAQKNCTDAWTSLCSETFAALQTPGDVTLFKKSADRILDTLTAAQSNNVRLAEHFSFRLEPFTHAHYGASGTGQDGTSRTIIHALTLIGGLALVASMLNFINLATAQALSRAREIALRKTLGATRRRLMLHFIGESLLLALIAGMAALMLTEIAVPIVAGLTGWDVAIPYGHTVLILIGTVTLVGIVAGFYPALLLSRFAPASVLAAAKMPAQGRNGTRLRLTLVCLQFVFALTLGLSTLIIDSQAYYLRHLTRGFDADHLLALSDDADNALDEHQTALLTAARALPGVITAGISTGEAFGSRFVNTVTLSDHGGPALPLDKETVSAGYFDTLGLKLLAGRLPDPANGADTGNPDGLTARNIVVSLATVKALGFSSPQSAIGHHLREANADDKDTWVIIGVVNNVRYNSGKKAPPLLSYSLQSGRIKNGFIILHVASGAMPQVVQRLQTLWPQLVPDVPFGPRPMRALIDEWTAPDVARGKLFTMGAVTALLIACLGLYGLAAFSAERRMHEVGIRKTLGASTGQIMRLLLAQFLRPVLLASLIAWPVSWACTRQWLSGFDQRITLSPLHFLAVTASALLLCLLTVLSRTIRLARAEPARALRSE